MVFCYQNCSDLLWPTVQIVVQWIWVTHFTVPVWRRWHLRCSVFTYSVILFEEKGSKHIGVEMCIRKKNVHKILMVSNVSTCARKSKLKSFQEGFLKTSSMKWKWIKTQDLGWFFWSRIKNHHSKIQWCRNKGGRGSLAPQYLADQLTLFQPGGGQIIPTYY